MWRTNDKDLSFKNRESVKIFQILVFSGAHEFEMESEKFLSEK